MQLRLNGRRNRHGSYSIGTGRKTGRDGRNRESTRRLCAKFPPAPGEGAAGEQGQQGKVRAGSGNSRNPQCRAPAGCRWGSRNAKRQELCHIAPGRRERAALWLRFDPRYRRSSCHRRSAGCPASRSARPAHQNSGHLQGAHSLASGSRDRGANQRCPLTR